MWLVRQKGQRARSEWISLPPDATLEDLHYAIHEQWGLFRRYHGTLEREGADDHLYAFWPSGKPWTGIGYVPPDALQDHEDELPVSTRLDELDLSLKQKIAYVYDFGESITLELSIEGIVVYDDIVVDAVRCSS